jgi:hypothetical protein
MIEVIANDRLGGKGASALAHSFVRLLNRTAVRVKCSCALARSVHPVLPADRPHSANDTVGDLKKLIAAQKGTKPEKVRGRASFRRV